MIGVERIAVLGAGSWGTALAFVLAENGHDVRIWGHRQQVIDQINETCLLYTSPSPRDS